MYSLAAILNFKTCGHWKSGAEDDESAPERSGTGREDPSSTNSRFSKVRISFCFHKF